MAIDKNLLGSAGEHLVLSRILAKELLATMAPGGYEQTDIFAHLDKNLIVNIQVKTTSTGAKGGWVMTKKHENIRDHDLFYCLVDMAEPETIVYVVPALKVASVIKEAHKMYLAKGKVKGGDLKDTNRRELKNNYTFSVPSAPNGWLDDYAEKWEQILNFQPPPMGFEFLASY